MYLMTFAKARPAQVIFIATSYLISVRSLYSGDINNGLIGACEAGCVEMATVLLDLGADVNYLDMVK
jgi:hypothetical protein